MTALPSLAVGMTAALVLVGCATWQAPRGMDDATLRARAQVETAHGVRVGAVLLEAQASEAMFGPGIGKAGVQPVWIEVENHTSQPLWLLRSGADPDYFSPLEVAWAMHRPLSGTYNARVDDYVAGLAFPNPIAPGARSAGVVFIHPQPVTVLLNVDLFGSATLVPFSLFLRHASSPPMFAYADAAVTEYRDMAALRSAIEHLPCCATNADGTQAGDPLNVVFVGNLADIAAACVRRDYRLDVRDFDKAQQVFGRAPDLVGRKQAQAGTPASWIRAWVAPMRFDGKRVYVAQVGRPVGGRFAARDAVDPVLHGDVDEARNDLVQEMMYSGGLEKLGFATGVGEVPVDSPKPVIGNASYFTDGLRAVLFFATRPLTLSDVEFLEWAPVIEGRDGATQGAGDARD